MSLGNHNGNWIMLSINRTHCHFTIYTWQIADMFIVSDQISKMFTASLFVFLQNIWTYPISLTLWITGLCLLSLKFYGQYWQDTFSHIQGHFRASSLPLPALSLVHFCQRESASYSLYQHTQQCSTGWGQERWRGNLLSTPSFPPSTITTQPPQLQCLTFSWL